MNRTPRIVSTTVVAVDPATAFEVFTTEVDAWWRRGPRFRPSLGGRGVLRFEPGPDGRLIESYGDGSVFVFGRIRAWQPGERLVFELIGRDFGPGEFTEVEVQFAAEGERTRVTIEHRGWDRFPDDHPARHALKGPAFNDVMGVWWADLLVALSSYVIANSTRGGP